jgi:hypothetical protein
MCQDWFFALCHFANGFFFFQQDLPGSGGKESEEEAKRPRKYRPETRLQRLNVMLRRRRRTASLSGKARGSSSLFISNSSGGGA